jgi:glc operon protein GlcG
MRLLTTAFIFAVCLCLGGGALAQTPPPPPAAGGTPETLPFGIPVGTPITVARAQQVVNAVLAEAHKHPAWAFAITVVEPSGELVYFYKMDNSQYASTKVSQGKAYTAARFRRETRAFYNLYETGHTYVSTLDPNLVASPGGFPLVENGKIIGAVGCSGGTGDQDATVCGAGAATVH